MPTSGMPPTSLSLAWHTLMRQTVWPSLCLLSAGITQHLFAVVTADFEDTVLALRAGSSQKSTMRFEPSATERHLGHTVTRQWTPERP